MYLIKRSKNAIKDNVIKDKQFEREKKVCNTY
jgi:hypothetical protein